MQALENRTQGAVGKMRELAQRAGGVQRWRWPARRAGRAWRSWRPRIAATRGMTRLLAGDTQQMAQSFVQAGAEGTTAYQSLIIALGPLGPLVRHITNSANKQIATYQALEGPVAAAAAAVQAEAAAAQQAAAESLNSGRVVRRTGPGGRLRPPPPSRPTSLHWTMMRSSPRSPPSDHRLWPSAKPS